MKKLFLLSTIVLLVSGVGFSQTDKGKGKDSTSMSKKPMPKPCPGKTCGKKKG